MKDINICPTCTSYTHCKQIGKADAEKCINFETRLDDSVMLKLKKLADNGFYSVDSDTRTFQIKNCEKISLNDKSLRFVLEFGAEKISSLEEIVINGIRFKKVTNDE